MLKAMRRMCSLEISSTTYLSWNSLTFSFPFQKSPFSRWAVSKHNLCSSPAKPKSLPGSCDFPTAGTLLTSKTWYRASDYSITVFTPHIIHTNILSLQPNLSLFSCLSDFSLMLLFVKRMLVSLVYCFLIISSVFLFVLLVAQTSCLTFHPFSDLSLFL